MLKSNVRQGKGIKIIKIHCDIINYYILLMEDLKIDVNEILWYCGIVLYNYETHESSYNL
jgi:hypothetical protein